MVARLRQQRHQINIAPFPNQLYQDREGGRTELIGNWKKLTKGIEYWKSLSHKHTHTQCRACIQGPEAPSAACFFLIKFICLHLYVRHRKTWRRKHTQAHTHGVLLVRNHHFKHTSLHSCYFQCVTAQVSSYRSCNLITISSLQSDLHHTVAYALMSSVCSYACLMALLQHRAFIVVSSGLWVKQPWALLPVSSTPFTSLLHLIAQ